MIRKSVAVFKNSSTTCSPSSGSVEHTEYTSLPVSAKKPEAVFSNPACLVLLFSRSAAVYLYLMSGFFLITPIEEHGASTRILSNFPMSVSFKLFMSAFITSTEPIPRVLRLSSRLTILFGSFSTAMISPLSSMSCAICEVFPPGAAHASGPFHLVLDQEYT